LIVPCEVAVRSVAPAVKALIATELVEKHGLKQDEVAEILGISQSAVSRYACRTRGHVIRISELKDVKPLIHKMTSLLLDSGSHGQELMTLFCRTCATVRKSGLACPLCQTAHLKVEIEQCRFCLT
jgi:predicted transcriptional regulator